PAVGRVSAGPPLAIDALMVVPIWLTGLPAASAICTTGCWGRAVPLGTVLDGSVVSTNFAAGPAARLIAVDVAEVSPPASKRNVYVPTGPDTATPANVAR